MIRAALSCGIAFLLTSACGADNDGLFDDPLVPDGDESDSGGGGSDGSGGGGSDSGGGGSDGGGGMSDGGGGADVPPGTMCEGLVYTMGGDPQEEILPPSCSGKDVDSWSPSHGPNGGLIGGGGCGSSSGACPTSYVEGNVGAACSSDGQCSGRNAVCLTGPESGGGTCSARGCEIGSNFGCPRGDTCIALFGDTYCMEGCGIDETECFVHCGRDGFSCFNTESKYLGYCLFADAVAQCDPMTSVTCTSPEYGDGVCDRTSWDDYSVGKCFESCNPIAQDCSNPAAGCYAVRDVEAPVCYENWGRGEGEACTRLTHCAKGLSCQDGFCRHYCMPGCDQCDAGETCVKINGWPYGACLPQ